MALNLTIDGRPVTVDAGATILDAARLSGIDIPTLCHRDGLGPFASCFMCAVSVDGRDDLVPACAAPARDGMVVSTDSEDVREARRAALELLLSDHVGDCVAPCSLACPAGLDIPGFLWHMAEGRDREAIALVRERLPLPATLGRICPRYCERVCRRADREEAIAICLLHRFAADVDLASSDPYEPPRAEPTGRSVAIVGAGPAGLSAAFYLLRQGHGCTLYDSRDEPGGALRYALAEDRLPRRVLEGEIGMIRRLGAGFRMSTTVGTRARLEELRREHDAVFLAFGAQVCEGAQAREGEPSERKVDSALCGALGIETGRRGIKVDGRTLRTGIEGVFAGGEAVTGTSSAVRAVAAGRLAAVCIGQHLSGGPLRGEEREVNVHMGRLSEGELAELFRDVRQRPRAPAQADGGLSEADARREAARCLQCDCAARDDCKLRIYATRYGARAARHRGERRAFRRDATHPHVVYESGKCILCGLCVRIAEREGERVGLTFLRRGFAAEVGVPFDASVAEALTQCADLCAEACPTGALALKRRSNPLEQSGG
ncbi:MAG: 2Fe-2S iron-sulfur cluster-binding protein [Candidatus Brocadiia bacterium]|nr:2Fe-2S iron-sulfur cluster-binding protein [Candidatus Brocadiia bacterium]